MLAEGNIFGDLTRTVTRLQTEGKHSYPSVVKTMCSPRVCWVWLRWVCSQSPGLGSWAAFSGSRAPAFIPTAVCWSGTSASPSTLCEGSLGQLLPLWHRPCHALGQSSLSDSAPLWAQRGQLCSAEGGDFS